MSAEIVTYWCGRHSGSGYRMEVQCEGENPYGDVVVTVYGRFKAPIKLYLSSGHGLALADQIYAAFAGPLRLQDRSMQRPERKKLTQRLGRRNE